MSRIQLVEPGTDILQLNTKRPPLKIPWVWVLIGFCVVAIALILFTRARADSEQQPAVGYEADQTRTAVATLNREQTRTPTGGPSLTPTAMMDGVQVPAIVGQGTTVPIGSSCAASTPQIREVQVTRVVSVPSSCSSVVNKVEVTRQVEVTRLATVLVPAATLTPMPTYTALPTYTPMPIQPTQTPWYYVVTQIVEVTSTPTPTATPTQTATPGSPDPSTPTLTPTDGPTPTATALMDDLPVPTVESAP